MSDQMRNFLPKKPAGFELGLPESQPRRWPLDHHHGPIIRPSWFRNRPLISTLTNEARFRERRNDVATLRRASNSSKSFPMRVSKPNLIFFGQVRSGIHQKLLFYLMVKIFISLRPRSSSASTLRVNFCSFYIK